MYRVLDSIMHIYNFDYMEKNCNISKVSLLKKTVGTR